MFKELKYIYQLHKNLILFLGFAYGATIVFPAFGPVLKIAAGHKMLPMSTVAFLCYTLSFAFPPTLYTSKRHQPKLAYIIISTLSPGILFFTELPTLGQWMILAIFSLFAGQLGSIWTQHLRRNVERKHLGRVVAMSIALTFFILYICTIIVTYTPNRLSLAIPLVLILISIGHFSRVYHMDSRLQIKPSTIDPKSNYHLLYLLFIIIYISGGFTYAGIFPKFEAYTFISKYYNVQPLFFTVIFAGVLADIIGRKTMLYIGFSMVGLSFTTFMMPASYGSYFLTQTFTQIGWGFVNSYVWISSADMSVQNNNRLIGARGVACMLMGTFIGAVLATFYEVAQITLDILYGAATLVPIFLGLILLNFIPETLTPINKTFHSPMNMTEQPTKNPIQLLTNREQEIALLIAKGYTRTQICDTLNISINTLKTHIRHIYKKLEISNKEALKEYYKELDLIG